MKRYSFLWVALLGGCMSQPDIGELVQDMVVQTTYQPGVNFGTYNTYTLPLDTVGLISNSSNRNIIVDAFSRRITNAIKRNMDATGRTRVDLDEDPDLGVNAYIVNDVSVYQSVSYPGYWGGYYGYGGFYGIPIVSFYTSNTAILVVEIADLRQIDPQTNRPRIIWIANLGDLITSVDRDAKVVEAIDQAFTQSAYLKK
ncbi:MAG: DUF4136 domain-containing protein [Bacteroidota bacterium]